MEIRRQRRKRFGLDRRDNVPRLDQKFVKTEKDPVGLFLCGVLLDLEFPAGVTAQALHRSVTRPKSRCPFSLPVATHD